MVEIGKNVNKVAQKGVNNGTGSKAGAVRVQTKSLGKNRSVFSSAGYVGANRSRNRYDVRGYNAERAANIIQSNRASRSYGTFGTYATGTTSNSSMDAMTGAQIGMAVAQGLMSMTSSIVGLAQMGKTISGSGNKSASGTDVKTLTGQLKNANSFSAINNLKNSANTKKANLNTDYQKLDISDKITDSKKELDDADVNLDNIPELSELDSDDLAASISTIDKDIENFTSFKDTTLPSVLTKVTEQRGELKGSIDALKIQYDQAPDEKKAEIKAKLDDAESKLKKLDDAKSAIANIETACDESISELQNKKSEVQDLKKFEDEIKDKEYSLAKSQDEDLKKTKDEITKLQNKLDELQSKNEDGKKADKIKELNTKLEGLYATRTSLTNSLGQAPKTVTNSKGENYTIVNLPTLEK